MTLVSVCATLRPSAWRHGCWQASFGTWACLVTAVLLIAEGSSQSCLNVLCSGEDIRVADAANDKAAFEAGTCCRQSTPCVDASAMKGMTISYPQAEAPPNGLVTIEVVLGVSARHYLGTGYNRFSMGKAVGGFGAVQSYDGGDPRGCPHQRRTLVTLRCSQHEVLFQSKEYGLCNYSTTIAHPLCCGTTAPTSTTSTTRQPTSASLFKNADLNADISPRPVLLWACVTGAVGIVVFTIAFRYTKQCVRSTSKLATRAPELPARTPEEQLPSRPELPVRTPAEELRYRSERLGISADYLVNVFVQRAEAATGLASPSFYDVSPVLAVGASGLGNNTVCPRDGQMGSSIVDSLVSPASAEATYFVSWCWGYLVADVASAVTRWSSRTGTSLQDTYLWMCFFCNNQYRLLSQPAPAGPANLTGLFESHLVSCGRVLLIMDNFMSPVYITRAWCIFECYVCTTRQLPLTVVLPESAETTFQQLMGSSFATVRDAFRQIDIRNARAHYKRDEDAIKLAILSTVGYDSVNDVVQGALLNQLTRMFQEYLRGYP